MEHTDLVGVYVAQMVVELPVGELDALAGEVMVQHRVDMRALQKLHREVLTLRKRCGKAQQKREPKEQYA